MGFRIDKSWAKYIPSTSSLKKREASEQQDQRDSQNSQEHHQGNQEQPSREVLEKLILEASINSELEYELFEKVGLLHVRIFTKNKQLVRELSGVDFFNLRAHAKLHLENRGKVLDQKC